MCGLTGYFKYGKNNSDKSSVQDAARSYIMGKLFDVSSTRGRDACGFAIGAYDYDNRKPLVVKNLSSPGKLSHLLQDWLYNSPAHPWVMCNARAIPEPELIEEGGGAREKDAQPVNVGPWWFTLNGVIANDKELFGGPLQDESTVDTFSLPTYLINQNYDPFMYSSDILAALKKIEGAYACALASEANANSFILAANFVPLYYVVDKDLKCVFYATMREWLESFFPNLNIISVPPYRLVHFTAGMDLSIVDLPLRPSPKKKVLVVCSGGLDSTVTASIYKHLKYKIDLLHFDYGCAARHRERDAVKEIAHALCCDAYFIPSLDLGCDSRLTSPNNLEDEVTWIQDAETTVSYVPARNAIFGLIAAGIAEKRGYDYVAQGLNLVDGTYPDNQLTYLRALDNLLPYALNWNANVHFRSPLVHCNKAEILDIGIKINAPITYSWSCYRGLERRCGRCGPCSYRLFAFHRLGIKDPAIYEQYPEGFNFDGCKGLSAEKLESLNKARRVKSFVLPDYILSEV